MGVDVLMKDNEAEDEAYGARSFSVAAPSLWNALPSEIRNAQSVSVFKRRLKTLLFRKAFYN